MQPRSRRDFLKAAALGSGRTLAFAAPPSRKAILLVIAEAPDAAIAEPVRRAAVELQQALQASGIPAEIRHDLTALTTDAERIVIAPPESAPARQIAGRARVSVPEAPESLALIAGRIDGQPVLLATGAGTRGQVYAALEVADRIRHAADPVAELRSIDRVVEQPANSIRSVARLFVSDVADKPWFYDKGFWTPYLTSLIAQRFNRFSLTLGLGYDLPKRVLDSYFIFAYPFLLSVPGYSVSVRGLPAGEPERNLAMLQWISTEAAALGLHFQLGLWSHTYQLFDSPNANYTIEGLTPANHGAYCRDAVRMLLKACPNIGGLTVRAHSESGIPDGSYDFWKTVFQGIGECGRRVELDLHSKGIDHRQIKMAMDTGQPVRVSPKLTAEHGGLPAHQVAIREQERRQASSTPLERSFTRYGYADYLAEDRGFGVYFRLWPGMQKLLLWGDPAIAAGYGRSAGFCGSLGLEYCEPLTFKGRQGSGLTPERRIYADDSLRPEGGDWRKYEYTYRLWGRLLYDPAAKPAAWRRYLRTEFGPAAEPVENSLAFSGRSVPLFTSAHLPSGSGLSYWPELYTNMPVADLTVPPPFGDTPSPKNFGHCSPLDPGLFSSAAEFAEQLAGRTADGRYSPADVAQWLDGFAAESERQWLQARTKAADPKRASFRRVEIDVHAVNLLAAFWARQMRAAIAWSVFEKNGGSERAAGCRVLLPAGARGVRETGGAHKGCLCAGPDVRRRSPAARPLGGPPARDRPRPRVHGAATAGEDRGLVGADRGRIGIGKQVAAAPAGHSCVPSRAGRRLPPRTSRGCGADGARFAERGPTPLPSRQPGGRISGRSDGRSFRRLAARHPGGVHGVAFPAALLLRTARSQRQCVAVPRA